MENKLDTLTRRWGAVEKETLSSVRRQFKAYTFDIVQINKDFHDSCDEWFNGRLAAAMWFVELQKTQPNKAIAFKTTVDKLNLNKGDIVKPKTWWAYAVTAISLPIVYALVYYLANWQMIAKAVFTVGIAVLVWTICKGRIIAQKHNYEEKIVAAYKKQLQEMGDKLKQIIAL